MKITKISIHRINPNKGHIGFVSCIVDGWLFLNNIAIFTRLNKPDEIRLVFPEKKVGDRVIKIFHPLTSESYYLLEKAVRDKLYEDK